MNSGVSGPGRPQKDPSEKKGRPAKIRLRPANKKIIDQEAERRGTRRNVIVETIGFEQIEPQERAIPQPEIYRKLFDKAAEMREKVENGRDDLIGGAMKGFKTDLQLLQVEVADRFEFRKMYHEDAEGQTRDETFSIRFDPGKKRWLESKAKQAGSPLLAYVRANTLEGIRERCRLEKIDEALQDYVERAKDLGQNTKDRPGAAARVRRGMEELAVEIEKFAREATFD